MYYFFWKMLHTHGFFSFKFYLFQFNSYFSIFYVCSCLGSLCITTCMNYFDSTSWRNDSMFSALYPLIWFSMKLNSNPHLTKVVSHIGWDSLAFSSKVRMLGLCSTTIKPCWPLCPNPGSQLCCYFYANKLPLCQARVNELKERVGPS